MHNVYEYVIDNQGIDIENSYPYRGRVSAWDDNSNIESSRAGVSNVAMFL